MPLVTVNIGALVCLTVCYWLLWNWCVISETEYTFAVRLHSNFQLHTFSRATVWGNADFLYRQFAPQCQLDKTGRSLFLLVVHLQVCYSATFLVQSLFLARILHIHDNSETAAE